MKSNKSLKKKKSKLHIHINEESNLGKQEDYKVQDSIKQKSEKALGAQEEYKPKKKSKGSS